MERVMSKTEKILKTIGWIGIVGSVVGMMAIGYGGKVFNIPYNSPLYVCFILVFGVIGFWIYAAIKGIDNVLVNEKRKTDDLDEMMKDLKESE